MRKFIVGVMLGCAVLSAKAADASFAGTHSVTFQPVQAAGTLIGCSLVYRAVQFDHAYLEGKPVIAIGNIGLHQTGGKMGFTLKVGVKPLAGNSPFVSPTFAYLQTKNTSTAKVKQTGQEVEKGFLYVVYSFSEPTVQQVIDEMIESGKVTLAFNRTLNGMDVLVPIDLDVIDTTYPGDNSIARVRSKETMNDFLVCYKKLLDQAMTSLEKE